MCEGSNVRMSCGHVEAYFDKPCGKNCSVPNGWSSYVNAPCRECEPGAAERWHQARVTELKSKLLGEDADENADRVKKLTERANALSLSMRQNIYQTRCLISGAPSSPGADEDYPQRDRAASGRRAEARAPWDLESDSEDGRLDTTRLTGDGKHVIEKRYRLIGGHWALITYRKELDEVDPLVLQRLREREETKKAKWEAKQRQRQEMRARRAELAARRRGGGHHHHHHKNKSSNNDDDGDDDDRNNGAPLRDLRTAQKSPPAAPGDRLTVPGKRQQDVHDEPRNETRGERNATPALLTSDESDGRGISLRQQQQEMTSEGNSRPATATTTTTTTTTQQQQSRKRKSAWAKTSFKARVEEESDSNNHDIDNHRIAGDCYDIESPATVVPKDWPGQLVKDTALDEPTDSGAEADSDTTHPKARARARAKEKGKGRSTNYGNGNGNGKSRRAQSTSSSKYYHHEGFDANNNHNDDEEEDEDVWQRIASE